MNADELLVALDGPDGPVYLARSSVLGTGPAYDDEGKGLLTGLRWVLLHGGHTIEVLDTPKNVAWLLDGKADADAEAERG